MKLRTRKTLGTLALTVGIALPLISAGLNAQPASVCHYDQLAGTPCPATGPAPASIVLAVALVIIGVVMLAPWWLHWRVGRPAPRDDEPGPQRDGQG
jgi:hypothetical protein